MQQSRLSRIGRQINNAIMPSTMLALLQTTSAESSKVEEGSSSGFMLQTSGFQLLLPNNV